MPWTSASGEHFRGLREASFSCLCSGAAAAALSMPEQPSVEPLRAESDAFPSVGSTPTLDQMLQSDDDCTSNGMPLSWQSTEQRAKLSQTASPEFEWTLDGDGDMKSIPRDKAAAGANARSPRRYYEGLIVLALLCITLMFEIGHHHLLHWTGNLHSTSGWMAHVTGEHDAPPHEHHAAHHPRDFVTCFTWNEWRERRAVNSAVPSG